MSKQDSVECNNIQHQSTVPIVVTHRSVRHVHCTLHSVQQQTSKMLQPHKIQHVVTCCTPDCTCYYLLEHSWREYHQSLNIEY